MANQNNFNINKNNNLIDNNQDYKNYIDKLNNLEGRFNKNTQLVNDKINNLEFNQKNIWNSINDITISLKNFTDKLDLFINKGIDNNKDNNNFSLEEKNNINNENKLKKKTKNVKKHKNNNLKNIKKRLSKSQEIKPNKNIILNNNKNLNLENNKQNEIENKPSNKEKENEIYIDEEKFKILYKQIKYIEYKDKEYFYKYSLNRLKYTLRSCYNCMDTRCTGRLSSLLEYKDNKFNIDIKTFFIIWRTFIHHKKIYKKYN